MKFGMTEEQFDLLEKLVITPLRALGADVYIFGSRVGPSYHHHSDVDILYSMRAGKTVDAVAISKIREVIEESRFPFKIDLVDEKDLAESYRPNVMRTRHAI
jgi:predicted nucleotidyltransferase